MVFFWKKNNKIHQMLDDYFSQCDTAFCRFENAMETFFSQGYGEAFRSDVEACHRAESRADDLRRGIEMTLYGKALLPESRGDLLGLIETFDSLPNMVDTIVYSMLCQQTPVPEDFFEDYRELLRVNIEAYHVTRKAVDALLNNPKVTLYLTKDVDEKESQSDRVERRIISKVFSSIYDIGTKILLRDLVLLIGEISDRAEKTADRIGIIAIKRQI